MTKTKRSIAKVDEIEETEQTTNYREGGIEGHGRVDHEIGDCRRGSRGREIREESQHEVNENRRTESHGKESKGSCEEENQYENDRKSCGIGDRGRGSKERKSHEKTSQHENKGEAIFVSNNDFNNIDSIYEEIESDIGKKKA
ncbi:3935_t:CDS:2 [Racocetra fulgida]|uniref:3935_t:CDS:1 n=1 Tax=Racocetra fulgida TaxID=60492 RepID=A0A9N9BHJ5_9GLOM|nr:3935_t:CDS:2 [Racocetra fulgida]